MTSPVTIDTITDRLRLNEFGTVEQVRSNRIRLKTTPERVHNAITFSRGMLGCDRLITISTVDHGTTFELLYHLIGSHRIIISISVNLSRNHPAIPTVSDLLPPAGIYERQIHDLFGIMFEGHPDLRKIILNEDWPADEFPLRKDWKPRPESFYGGIKVERS
jgi:NADH-quinone oxidoreductase subunit C